MDLLVRPAGPEDPCAPLLFASAEPYYTAYAGGAKRALKLLERAYRERDHAASYEYCRVALAEGEVVGLAAGFPVSQVDRAVAALRPADVPAPAAVALADARSGTCARPASSRSPRRSTPTSSTRSRSTPAWRRKGVAQHLLDDAQQAATEHGFRKLALDTGLHNRPARALYEAYGFDEREIRRAPSEKIARALGGPGFIGYLKAV